MEARFPEYASDPYQHTTTYYGQLLNEFGSKENLQKSKKKHIAILGAGISGLLAGFLLKHLGHNVRIYEASNTVGGRIKTLRDRFTTGYYAEAGAMRIPSHHTLALDLVETFDLPCLKFPGVCPAGNTIFFINNHRHTLKEYQSDKPDFGFQLEGAEVGRSAEDLLNDSILRHLKMKESCFTTAEQKANGWGDVTFDKLNNENFIRPTANVLKYLDQFSLYDFLRDIAHIGATSIEDKESVKLSAKGANYICSVLALEMSMPVSMAHVLDMIRTLFHAPKLYQIDDGMDWLPKAFIGLRRPPNSDRNGLTVRPGVTVRWLRGADTNMSQHITYNARVTKIAHESKENHEFKLRVHYENTVSRQPFDEEFDLVVSSMPFSALRHVAMDGLASSDKRRALRQLHYDNACKVLLEFTKPFWVEAPFCIQGGKTITDLPIRQTFYPHPVQNKNNVLLASYTWGDDSVRWTGLKSDDRLRFALRDLASVHNIELRDLEESFVGGMSHSWAEHEFTSGAFAVFEPHQYNDLFPHIWKPEGRIHYCGEHTSTKHGWIEGAIESAIRVVKEIYHRIEACVDLNDNNLPPEFAPGSTRAAAE